MARCDADKLTRKYLEKQGYIVAKCESYNAFIKRKKDLFGFLDYLAIHPIEKRLLAIQTTSKSNLSTRIKKAENLNAYWSSTWATSFSPYSSGENKRRTTAATSGWWCLTKRRYVPH